MSLKVRRIKVNGTKDELELVCTLSRDFYKSTYELFANGISQDKIEISSLNGIKGVLMQNYSHELHGVLSEDVLVTAKIEGHFLKRPKYTITVGNQLVHKEKGVWFGL